jgi:hypothetical protein
VFGGRARKRVKSDRSWIGSVTTIERVFPMERTTAPQASETEQPTAAESECAWRHSSSDWQKRWGARRSRDGVRGRDGVLSSFLGANGVAMCRNTADQPFLLLMLESAVFMPRWCFRWVFLRAKEETLRLAKLDRS